LYPSYGFGLFGGANPLTIAPEMIKVGQEITVGEGAKVEAGNFDILELAPTVQCLTGNYRIGENEYIVPFINEVLNASDDSILYSARQSEEGGRFYREQNINSIIKVTDNFPVKVPENYCWMTLNQLLTFLKFNNYLNIAARSLISAISF
jgi:oxidase EvaA